MSCDRCTAIPAALLYLRLPRLEWVHGAALHVGPWVRSAGRDGATGAEPERLTAEPLMDFTPATSQSPCPCPPQCTASPARWSQVAPLQIVEHGAQDYRRRWRRAVAHGDSPPPWTLTFSGSSSKASLRSTRRQRFVDLGRSMRRAASARSGAFGHIDRPVQHQRGSEPIWRRPGSLSAPSGRRLRHRSIADQPAAARRRSDELPAWWTFFTFSTSGCA